MRVAIYLPTGKRAIVRQILPLSIGEYRLSERVARVQIGCGGYDVPLADLSPSETWDEIQGVGES